MKNILIIPNITYQKDLSKDSFIQVMFAIITSLNEIRNDLYFHIPLTNYCESLDFENVSQYFIKLPTYPNSMRGHFDFNLWKDIIDWKNKDIDLIYSHLPEHTTQVINLISNTTNIGVIPIIGYTHWSEIKEITNYDKTYLLNNINGLLEMESCGINTDAQKKLLINNVKEIYSNKTLKKLDEILKPIYLGVEKFNITKKINVDSENIIVFNHRTQTYKDFPFFMKMMDKLYSIRQDFKVWIPLLESKNREYVITDKFEKKGYYENLNKCKVTFCPKQKYEGWSVSGTDSLMCGCPVVFFDNSSYKELAGESGVYYNDENELLELFNKFLDNNNYRNKIASKQLKYVNENMLWSSRIKPINEQINNALKLNKCASDRSIRAKEMLTLVKSKKSITKKEILDHFGWGVGIKFQPYRNFLLQNGISNLIYIENKIGTLGIEKKTYDRYINNDSKTNK